MALPNMTKKELAEVAGYTYRRLYDIDRALPDDAKLFVEASDGKYDLGLFVQRWVQYNVAHEVAPDSSYEEAKTKHEIIKTAKTELEVAKMKGQLIDVQDVKKLWGDVVNAATQNMLSLPKKMGPVLVMQESAEIITSMIDEEVRRILNDLADTPLPAYVEDDEGETDGDDE